MTVKRRYDRASSRIAKRHKARKYAGIFLKINLPIALIVGLVFLLRADFLQVKNIEVLGAETISQESIKNMASSFMAGDRLFVIPKSDILLLSKGKLASALLSKFPRLQKVAVNKQFLSESVILSLTERKADFLWCSPQEECFFMSKDGLIFEKSNFAEASLNKLENKVIFRGNLEGNPLMKNFDTTERMQNYSKFIGVFGNAGFNVSAINAESSDKAIAKTKIGDIIFNPEETNLSLAAQNSILLINEVRSKNPSALFNYIDARFGNKIYYKLL